MRSKKLYRGQVAFCKLPTLAEAMDHFRQTGEFILSARDDDAYDSNSRDFDPIPVESGEVDLVSSAANRKRDQDTRGVLKDNKTPGSSDPAPGSSDPAPGSSDPAPGSSD